MTKTHGMRRTRFYTIWCGMKRRCFNKNDSAYVNYGARGITVCEEWLKFEGFKRDLYESYIDHAREFGEKDTSIERIENDGNYELKNCKWATRKEQNANTRQVKLYPYKGEMLDLAEISRREGMNYRTLRARLLQYDWTLEQSLERSNVKWSKKDCELFNHNGKLKTITEIAREEGINKTTLFDRIKIQKMSMDEAIKVPPFQKEFKATNIKTGESYIYKSQADFARDFNFNKRGKISEVLNGKRKSTYGFKFEYT